MPSYANNILFTADLHFGHRGVIEFCNRPWKDVERMDNGLISLWNATVKDSDHVYVLGDFSFHNAQETHKIAACLKGHKILVLGNHDKHSRSQYIRMGFVDVVDKVTLTLLGKRLQLSHFPYWPEHPELEPKHELRYPHLRPVKSWGKEILLCGHVHMLWKTLGRQINVGCDQWKYRPVLLSQIEHQIALIEKESCNALS